MDPISLAVGGGLLALGYVMGLVTRRRKPASLTGSHARCDCGHALAVHDAATNACHEEIPRNSYNKKGDYVGEIYVPCPCRQYVGPRPIEDIVSNYLPPAP